MVATLVHIQVKPEFIADFVRATQHNHELSVTEEGNFRFDVLQEAADPTKFILYEVYQSEQAVAAHKETPHYFEWRDTVSQWMARPREGIKYQVLYPGYSK